MPAEFTRKAARRSARAARPHTVATASGQCGRRPETDVNALRLLPVVLALGVLAAHFFRAGAWIPFGITIAILPILLIRAPWAARVLQVALLAGAVEWLRTAAALIAIRQSLGQPYTRLALILGGVALATVLCALLFRWRPVRERFRLPGAG
jgi:uncharacterized membrane protein YgaE (UPF0421/DUF939 family)